MLNLEDLKTFLRTQNSKLFCPETRDELLMVSIVVVLADAINDLKSELSELKDLVEAKELVSKNPVGRPKKTEVKE